MMRRHCCLALAASALMAPGIWGKWSLPPLKRVIVTLGPWTVPSSCQRQHVRAHPCLRATAR